MDFSVSLYSSLQIEVANNFIKSLDYRGYKGDRHIEGFAIEDNYITYLSTKNWFHGEIGRKVYLSISLNVIKYIKQ